MRRDARAACDPHLLPPPFRGRKERAVRAPFHWNAVCPPLAPPLPERERSARFCAPGEGRVQHAWRFMRHAPRAACDPHLIPPPFRGRKERAARAPFHWNAVCPPLAPPLPERERSARACAPGEGWVQHAWRFMRRGARAACDPHL